MNNIETAYKCRMIKEWCSEMSKKGRFFNFKIVYDIDRKIEKNWVLTEKQHNAIQKFYHHHLQHSPSKYNHHHYHYHIVLFDFSLYTTYQS